MMLTHYLKSSSLYILILSIGMVNAYANGSNFNAKFEISKYLEIPRDKIRIKELSGLPSISQRRVVRSKVMCTKELGRCSIVADVITSQGYAITTVNWYELDILTQSPTLHESVEKGERYKASKVIFKEEFTRFGTCPDKTELENSEYLKSFNKGERITSRMLRENLIVVAGDEIVVRYLDRLISVEASAIALSSGALGNEINIVRGQGEKAFRAVIVGPKMLEVKI